MIILLRQIRHPTYLLTQLSSDLKPLFPTIHRLMETLELPQQTSTRVVTLRVIQDHPISDKIQAMDQGKLLLEQI